MDLIDKGFYSDKVWIQCEYEDCLKWRLLTNEDAAFADSSKPWYCHMNSDSWFNCCSVPEESYPEESAFHVCGLKLVYSQLPLGSLVLTKMYGWPSWPSILCPDRFTGEYVMYDEDGFAEQYHTEFLGKPHTRSWIAVRHIEPYCTMGKLGDLKKSRQWYKSAFEEAKMVSGLNFEERLKLCQLSNQGEMVSASAIPCGKASHVPITIQQDFMAELIYISFGRFPAQIPSKVAAEVLKKSHNKKNRELMQNKLMAEKKENLNKVKGQKQSKREISQSTSGRYKRKLQKSTQESRPIIGLNDILASESRDVLQAEDLMQDLEEMLKQIKESDKCTSSFMLEKQESSKNQGHKKKLSNWNDTVSEEAELKDSTDGEEDCIVIDGIEFKTGKCIEEITNQLKEIDVLMAELEGCI